MSSGVIIDKREQKNKSAPNRQKFIERYKDVLKEHVERIAGGKKQSIKDIAKKRDIKIDKKTLDEPSYQYDYDLGPWDRVLPGNKKMVNGDRIPIPTSGGKGSGAGKGNGEDSVDEFSFTLTKEEFLDILFDGLALPDFIKNGLKTTEFLELQRAGYTKEGSPCQLDLKKTFENAIARRIATRSEDKNPAFLDDIDLRYKHFAQVSKPSREAVMFCLLDVSGSMDEELKSWSKKYFLLLYLFLEKTYTNVQIIFIRHTEEAEEVDEQEFFYGRHTGGTVLSSALELTHNIITERFNPNDINIYIAQCSDGDNWPSDDEVCIDILKNKLLPITQYFSYLELAHERMRQSYNSFYYTAKDKIQSNHSNFKAVHCTAESQIFYAFRDLFKQK